MTDQLIVRRGYIKFSVYDAFWNNLYFMHNIIIQIAMTSHAGVHRNVKKKSRDTVTKVSKILSGKLVLFHYI